MKLEIGPGNNPLDGDWETIGYKDFRWGQDRLPYPDNHFSEVYASHVLEHVPWHQTNYALTEALRVLKPGGLAEFWVPDLEYMLDAYNSRQCGDKWRRFNPEGHPMKWFLGRLFTYGPGEDNYHRAAFDEIWLAECMETAGFKDVKILRQRTRGTSHGPIDLGVTGCKA